MISYFLKKLKLNNFSNLGRSI